MMRPRSIRCLAAIVSIGVGAQPVAAFYSPAMQAAICAGAIVEREAASGGVEPDLEHQRVLIAAQLEALGETPGAALAAAGLLTADDLAVLLANPAMMQRAGELTHSQVSIIIGVAIVAAIVLLAVYGSGFVSFH